RTESGPHRIGSQAGGRGSGVAPDNFAGFLGRPAGYQNRSPFTTVPLVTLIAIGRFSEGDAIGVIMSPGTDDSFCFDSEATERDDDVV
ncbi:hypothetical protein GW17_00052667, partial [Ensete ventricosum]